MTDTIDDKEIEIDEDEKIAVPLLLKLTDAVPSEMVRGAGLSTVDPDALIVVFAFL